MGCRGPMETNGWREKGNVGRWEMLGAKENDR